jgi:hypothetical protein
MTPPPTSRPPAGVPGSGGGAKYAIVAALLVLGIGALFFWRSQSEKDHTVGPIPSASTLGQSAERPNPKMDDIPLPAPVEEKPEGGTGPRIIYVQGPSMCEGKCSGTAPPELGAALQVRASQSRRCYNQALAQDTSLRGHVTISVRIGPSGAVCSATVASNDMGTPNVANCAANIFRTSGNYPAPRGGCVDATVPMSFVPQGQ